MKKALTMVELIFVIVILGILSTVAIPKIYSVRNDAEVTKAVTFVSTLMRDIQTYYLAKDTLMTNEKAAYESGRTNIRQMTNQKLYGDNKCTSFTPHKYANGPALNEGFMKFNGECCLKITAIAGFSTDKIMRYDGAIRFEYNYDTKNCKNLIDALNKSSVFHDACTDYKCSIRTNKYISLNQPIIINYGFVDIDWVENKAGTGGIRDPYAKSKNLLKDEKK